MHEFKRQRAVTISRFAAWSFLIVATPVCATENVPITLKPIAPWQLDWSSRGCMLRRVFGTPEQPFILQFERFEQSDKFQLVLIGTQLRELGSQGNYSITYGKGGFVHELQRVLEASATAGGTPAIHIGTSYLSKELDNVSRGAAFAPAIERATTEIVLARTGRRIVFETGSLGTSFQALRDCTDRMVQEWGLDPVRQRSVSTPPAPQGNPSKIFKSLDYPRKALDAGKRAVVNFRLMIDEKGATTDCEVQSSYADKEFDLKTCNIILSRIRFSPAIDNAGHATPSYYVNTVNWLSPDD